MTCPALELLVQAYLNLDWSDDYLDSWAAIDDFVASEPIAAQLADEVTMLLESGSSEGALRQFVLEDLGSGYLPEADGLTMRGWLVAVRRRVERANGR